MTLIVSTHMRKYNVHNNYGGTHIMHTHTHGAMHTHNIQRGVHTQTHRGRYMHMYTHTHTHTQGLAHA